MKSFGILRETLRFRQRLPRCGSFPHAPLLVLLHGYSQNRYSLLHALAPALKALPEFRVLSVEGPLDLGRQRYAWGSIACGGREFIDCPVENIPVRVTADTEGFLRSRDAVADLLGRQGVPAESLFVLGFSQGASLCLSLMTAYPALAKHYLPLSGFPLPGLADSADASGRLRGIKVLSFHGTEDVLVPFAAGEKALDLYRAGGAEATFLPFPGGHAIVRQEQVGIVHWVRAKASLPPVSSLPF